MCDCEGAREGGERHLVASDFERKRQATAREAGQASLTRAPAPIYALTVEIAPDHDPYRAISRVYRRDTCRRRHRGVQPMLSLQCERHVDPIRSDPRFKALLTRLGIPARP